MTVREQLRWWGLAAAVFLAALWALGSVLLPFVVGGAIAYFLDPVADRLERAGCSRALAVTIIAVGAVLVAVLALLLVVPTLIAQASGLVQAAPAIFGQLKAFLAEHAPSVFEPDSPARRALDAAGAAVQARGAELIRTLFTSAMTVIDALVFVLVVPVVAFYMLLDWDRMVATLDRLLPRDHAPTIRRLAAEIDDVLAGFVRGQLSVCLILGAFYALALILLGLDYGLVVGSVAGLLTFIPYVGATIGGVLSVGLALFQFWGEPWLIGAVAAVFVAGQFLEGNFLTPKLVGGSVGLHPVWLLFALSAFGRFFGFVGLLVAVPVAAALGVLTRFGIEQYLAGRLYLGSGGAGGAERSADGGEA